MKAPRLTCQHNEFEINVFLSINLKKNKKNKKKKKKKKKKEKKKEKNYVKINMSSKYIYVMVRATRIVDTQLT